MSSINRASCTKNACAIAVSEPKIENRGGYKEFDILTMYAGIAFEDRKRGYEFMIMY
jgi:hypothetical protein